MNHFDGYSELRCVKLQSLIQSPHNWSAVGLLGIADSHRCKALRTHPETTNRMSIKKKKRGGGGGVKKRRRKKEEEKKKKSGLRWLPDGGSARAVSGRQTQLNVHQTHLTICQTQLTVYQTDGVPNTAEGVPS